MVRMGTSNDSSHRGRASGSCVPWAKSRKPREARRSSGCRSSSPGTSSPLPSAACSSRCSSEYRCLRKRLPVRLCFRSSCGRRFDETDAELASAFDVVVVPRWRCAAGTRAGRRRHCDRVYGSDETVTRDVGARHPSGTRHPTRARREPRVLQPCLAGTRTTTFDEFALDVCAYDQRGCLSPQAIYVEGDLDGRR